MKTHDFYFDLPQELIAQTPLERRDGSRLLVLDKKTGAVEHRHFYDLPEYLRPGDCLILNNSRVLPARLLGHRMPGGGACEILLLIDRGDNVWECLVRPGKKLRKGARVSFGDGELTAEVVDELPDGNRLVRFEYEGIFLEVLERLGKMPLPPYIKEELQDQERYQTVYSKVNGSAAAPTAGLHFTPELLERVQTMGVKVGYVTLHVGLGTFRPVKEDEITDHTMHSEYCVIPQETADLINETKKNGGRVICVGTTSCRTIEISGSGGWNHACQRRMDRHFYLSGVQVQGAGRTGNKLSSAGVHTHHAGIGIGGTRARAGGLSAGGGGTVPLLLVWRCDVHWRRDAIQGRKRRKARKIRVFGGNGLTGAKSRKSRMDN